MIRVIPIHFVSQPYTLISNALSVITAQFITESKVYMGDCLAYWRNFN